MKQTAMTRCVARWVPGTSNRLLLEIPEGETTVVSLERFEQVCGRQATFDLYLVGRITVELPTSDIKNLVA